MRMKRPAHTSARRENEIRADIAPGSGINKVFALQPLNPYSPIYPYTPSSGASTVRFARKTTLHPTPLLGHFDSLPTSRQSESVD
jgi:hypothetical protein